MGRIVAIDFGAKRTGIAVTDPLQIIAGKMDTVPTPEAVSVLTRYAAEEKVDEIVVGHPLRLNGSEQDIMSSIAPFVERLKKSLPGIPVVLYDERFTSKMAVQSMVTGGMPKAERRKKANIDRVSSVLLLQSYLAWKNTRKERS